jgi:hypothetical protein
LSGKLFKKKTAQPVSLTAQPNARPRPMERGELFKDPLAEAMEDLEPGTTRGGGKRSNRTKRW